MKVELWPIDRLIPYEKNPRKISKKAVAKVAVSIREFGFRQAIVADEAGVILVGHTRRLAAIDLDLKKVPVHVATGLSEAQKKAYRIADNRTNEESDWLDEMLSLELKDLKNLDFDLSLTGFDVSQVNSYIRGLDGEAPEAEIDRAEELRVKWGVERGQLWEIGKHRLMCGDCTDAATVEELMQGERGTACLTDPPYNVGKQYGDATNDQQDQKEYIEWSRVWFSLAKQHSEVVVLTSGITNLPMWITEIERTHRIIAWVKENQNSRNYIGSTSGFNVWEPILVFGKSKKCVARDSFSLPIGIQSDVAGHPCPKPVKAWSWLIENFTDSSDLILEPFGGSGTCFVAADQSDRRCYGLEIEPKYCAVILERLSKMGLTPQLARAPVVQSA